MVSLKFVVLTFGLVALLSGCADQGIKVDGKFGTPVRVSIETVVKVKDVTRTVIDEGDGPELKSGDLVAYQVAYFNGTTGDRIKPGEFGTARGISTYTVGQGAYLDKILQKVKVHSRILAQVPGALLWGSDSRPEGVGERDNAVVVLDVLNVIATKLNGPKKPSPPGLPTVVDSANGPKILPVTAPAPQALSVVTLIEGSGHPVKPTDKVTVHYVGALWSGKVFDSSWNRRAPAEFLLDGLIKGVKDGLVGAKVGSRLLIVVPPALGYGDKAQGDIPANSTLIFVFDILMATSRN
ncbi:FKBP-type peptidyl-prolyl cis-trans isomerase [Tropheryma whipplei]|uniref:Peptidyl-prolyl cis-trans isomerase n=1 Tax=Tropheryma whipplei (strain Twist) TaxID=203267 RepID=Q83GH0_TROWT|nr:FKBP-type peptidyl-prolyl cis-trans isomerase [Tropheryma whipplei]AAO44416.1 putative FKBP-type peptidyl-prolyl cis-trans isomerase [Tropheryma whipplei str. Twist]MCO8182420.1 FKBP-type peptidyl-prolyl cis-trans isomerase [Tropheryma whipplei]MCO8190190.1 FKBP-type peptidyl-prolyl cis-trans isomerase [Tropheryma whipplei]CAD67121.1 putative drug-binding lipoprotein [Tropheryma whipplei TW08/27]